MTPDKVIKSPRTITVARFTSTLMNTDIEGYTPIVFRDKEGRLHPLRRKLSVLTVEMDGATREIACIDEDPL
jgi:hypothetical protein